MTEHQKETAFLRHLILFDDTDERRKLEERITQVQRDERCVRRAVSLMVLFTALGAVGFAYGVILLQNFPYGEAQSVIKFICALGLASLISLVAFVGLLMAYRRKLNRLREECRRLVTNLLEFRLGKPHLTRLRGSRPGAGGGEVARGTVEVNGPSDRLDPSREGVRYDVSKTSLENICLSPIEETPCDSSPSDESKENCAMKLNVKPTGEKYEDMANGTTKATQRTGEPEASARTGVPERFRRLNWNELVCRGDFVADEHGGFEPWQGLGGFRANAFVKTIFRREETGKIQPTAKRRHSQDPALRYHL